MQKGQQPGRKAGIVISCFSILRYRKKANVAMMAPTATIVTPTTAE